MRLWLLVISLLVPCLMAAKEEVHPASYLILAPKTIHPGLTFTLNIDIRVASGPVTISARIKTAESSTGPAVEGETTAQAGQLTSLDLQIPDNLPAPGSGGQYQLEIMGTGGGITFNDTQYLQFDVTHFAIFIQTDKGIYKPGQTVNYRVLGVYPGMLPYMGPFDLEIRDPAGNIIFLSTGVQNETYGVITQSLVMSSEPVLGDWTIKATAEGQEKTATVTIDEYVLPKFDVDVILPPYISGEDGLNIQIDAKYTYGKPLKGKAVVTVKFGYYGTKEPFTRTLQIDGTADVMIPHRDLVRQADNLYNGMFITVSANVTEELTGLIQGGSATVMYYTRAVKVEPLPVASSVFKPGLTYRTFLAVTHQDGSMLNDKERRSSVTLMFQEYVPSTGNKEWVRVAYSIPESGIIEGTYDVSADVTSLQLKAYYDLPSTKELDSEYPAYSAYLTRMDSPSMTYLQINLESQQVAVEQEVTMTVVTTENPVKLTYIVIAQANIAHSGTQDTSSTTNNIMFTVTPDMAPKARVIVSFVTAVGEVVVDSVELQVDGAFKNQVSISFDKDTSEPGDDISFSVGASQRSLVGVLAVDQSVLILKSGNDITQEQVIGDISAIDTTGSGGDQGWPRGDILFRKRRTVLYPRYSSGNSAKQILSDAGLLTFTDALVHGQDFYFNYGRGDDDFLAIRPMADTAAEDAPFNRKSSGNAVPTGTEASQITVRKTFPETWLWSEAIADSEGRVTIRTQVPDTITSWLASAFAVSTVDGLGVAPAPSKTTVFKPFFVSLNLPYSVVRYETLILQATVFNYFEEDVKASVSLKKAAQYEIMSVNENGVEKASLKDAVKKEVTVRAGSGASVFFPIRIIKSGLVSLEVRAETSKAGDAVRRQLLVEPEGVAHSTSESRLFNEAQDTDINEVFSIDLPPPDELVEGSVRALLSITGDIMGPTMNNLDSLLKMPYGCGEQNMMNFAPDVFVYEYLTVSDQNSPAIKDKAYRFMISGYQRELRYKHEDGSFSAFGEDSGYGDETVSGSVWLTSFVVRSFSGASKFIYIDPNVIDMGAKFIVRQQVRTGSFNEPGKIIDRGIEGGVSPGTTLTAYITIALQVALDSQNLTQETRANVVSSVALAKAYLEGQLSTISSDSYALALVTYALALTESIHLAAFRQALDDRAITQGGQRYWSNAPDEPVEKSNDFWYDPYHGPSSSDVEMTSYALLAYLKMGDQPGAASIAKWLTHQRNAFGGYGSTQDTVVGLQALTQFALVFSEVDPQANLRVALSSNPDYTQEFSINSNNAIVLQQAELPTESGDVTVAGRGRGTCLMTLAVFYNLKAIHKRKAFEYDISIEESRNGNNLDIRACGRYIGEAEATSMVLMDIPMVSGFSADTDHLRSLQREHQLVQKYEINRQSVYLYFQEMPKDEETCVTVHATRSNVVANVQPKYARILDYYNPSEQEVVEYLPEALKGSTICDVCPECEGCPGGGAKQPLLSLALLLATLFVAVFVGRV